MSIFDITEIMIKEFRGYVENKNSLLSMKKKYIEKDDLFGKNTTVL